MTTNPAPNIHYPRPAKLAALPCRAGQRFFSNELDGPIRLSTDAGLTGRVRVMRNAAMDFAELQIGIGIYTRTHIDVCMTPAELRNLAARLIDAAHDIEAFPAITLAAAAPEGGAA